jgi:hypothetical protein
MMPGTTSAVSRGPTSVGTTNPTGVGGSAFQPVTRSATNFTMARV